MGATTFEQQAAIIKSELRLAEARQSFPKYCEYVHSQPLYPHQMEWEKRLTVQPPQALTEALGDSTKRYHTLTLIVAPPVTLKSTTVRMKLEWFIGNNPDIAILLLMNTATQSQKQVMTIARTIESNPRYQEVFPWVVPDKDQGWSHDTLFVKRKQTSRPDPTLYGTGWVGPYQGNHPDIVVGDDPTDELDVDSPATMDAQRRILRGVLIDRPVHGGSIFVILSRWGEADLVPDLVEMGFTKIENPVEGSYPWGRLLVPEIYSDDRIQELQEMKGAFYPLTYMCNPAAAVGNMIKREWWRYYSQEPEKWETCIHSWDLATGSAGSSSRSAFGCWRKGENGYYLTNAGAWDLTMEPLIKKMNLMYEMDKPRWVLVEDSSPSKSIIQQLQAHTRLPLKLVKPGTRDKKARLRAVAYLIEAGRVWLPPGQPWLREYIEELAVFPGRGYDDYVDMTSQALEFLTQQGTGKIGGAGAYQRRGRR